VVVAEALEVLRAGRIRSGAIAVLSLVAGAVSAWIGAMDMGASLDRYERAERAGDAVWQINGQQLRGSTCENLSRHPLVLASGTMLETSSNAVDRLGTQIRVRTVTAGLIPIAWPEQRSAASTVAGVDLARTLGLVDEAVLRLIPTSEGVNDVLPVRLDRVAQTPSRFEEFDRALIAVGPPAGLIESCWVEASRGARSVVRELAIGELSADPGAAVVAAYPIAVDAESTDEVIQAFGVRATRFISLLGAFLASAGLMASWLSRSREFAVYRLCGLGRISLLAIMGIEAGLLGLLPFSVGWATLWAFSVRPGFPTIAEIAALDLVAAIALMVTGVVIASAGFSARDPLRVLRAG
jgi:hypothetical protein